MMTTSAPNGSLIRRVTTISIGCAITAFLIVGCDQSQDERAHLNDGSPTATRAPAGDDIAMQSSPGRNATSSDQHSNAMREGNEQERMAIVDRAVAEVTPTAGYEASGSVSFIPNYEGTKMEINITLSGLKPGKHGLHIHQAGDCSAPDASSAGGHLNPDDEMHGSPQDAARHLGDLGNIEADANGRVETTLTVSDLGFSGSSSVLQKAIIVHAREDDLKSDPAGNSGDPVGCGVIRHNAGELALSMENESSVCNSARC